MKSFWDFLLIKSLPKDSLKKVQFSIFGFGDSRYEKYNAVARKLFQRMLQLGASELAPRGLGDDQKDGGFLIDLYPWKKKLFENLEKFVPGFQKRNERVEGLLYAPKAPISVQVTRGGMVPESIDSKRLLGDLFEAKTTIFEGKLETSRRETAKDHFQDVRTLEFRSSTPVTYDCGDVLEVFPENCPGAG